MLAPTGTPLQAVVSGFVTHNAHQVLGGITLSLIGDNGNRYYYGHLSAYEGAPRDGSSRARSSATSATPGTPSAFRTCISRSTRTSVSR